jgi:phospholipase/carboxylesterase
MTEALRFLERPAAGDPEGALVLFHGRGADEYDLFPLLDALDPERRLLGITPRGPLALPPGGAHWYRLGGIPTPDPGTFFASYEAAGSFLDALPMPIGRVVVGGFSQGAVMSWALSLGAGRPRPAAVIALSGFMPQVEGFALDLTGLDGYPIAVAHGSLDPVIPVARESRAAHDRPSPAAGAAGVCEHRSGVTATASLGRSRRPHVSYLRDVGEGMSRPER